jgi:precorrin-6A/cobalt-precorrin-6A reductase
MILLLGGTSDAREIARGLRADGADVLVTVVTGYGAELAGEDTAVRLGALDADALRELARSAEVVVDATHPFAAVVSRMAIEVCAGLGVPYLRYERPASALSDDVYTVDTAEEAAQLAVRLAAGGTLFLTVGSKTLAPYVAAARAAGCPLLARVLPTAEVLQSMEALGLTPRDVLAMQGPTTRELEVALLRHAHAAVLVTKESGSAGGVLDKLAAAAAVGIPAVVVGRPRVEYPRAVSTVDDVVTILHHRDTEAQRG